jgi:hypothetical protein
MKITFGIPEQLVITKPLLKVKANQKVMISGKKITFPIKESILIGEDNKKTEKREGRESKEKEKMLLSLSVKFVATKHRLTFPVLSIDTTTTIVDSKEITNETTNRQ